MGVASREPNVPRQRLDRVVARRPFGRLHDHIQTEIGRPERREEGLDIFGRANVRIVLLELPVDRSLVLQTIVDVGGRIGC